MFWYISHVISLLRFSLTPVSDRLKFLYLYILKCSQWRHQKMILWSHQFFFHRLYRFFYPVKLASCIYFFWWWRDFINYAEKKILLWLCFLKINFLCYLKDSLWIFFCLFWFNMQFLCEWNIFVLNNWWEIFNFAFEFLFLSALMYSNWSDFVAKWEL